MDETKLPQPQTAPGNGEQPGSRAMDAHGAAAHGAVLHYDSAVRPKWALRDWAWFLLKNVLGWALILSSFVLGPLVPGPGGIPLFLVGFGLITFPGKRRITARVLSGAPVDPASRAFRRGVALVAIFAPLITLAY